MKIKGVLKRVKKLDPLLKNFLKRNWSKYLLGILALIAVDSLQLVPPRLLGILVDKIKGLSINLNGIIVYLVGILLVAGGMFLCRFFWRYLIRGTAIRFAHHTRMELFKKLLELSQSFFDFTPSGDLMARFTNDVRALQMMTSSAVVMLTDALFLSIVTFTAMGYLVNWRLTLIACIPFPLLALVSLTFGKLIHERFMQVQERFSDLTRIAEETVSGIRVVKSCAIEDTMFGRFSNIAKANIRSNMNLVKIWGLLYPLFELIGGSGVVIALIIGGKMVIFGTITLGEFVTFNVYLGMLIWPMIAMGWVLNVIQRGRASLKRIRKILDEKSLVAEPESPKKVQIHGNIDIHNLTFAYPGNERIVLKNINMKIRKGWFVGITGKTGSGKSTLIKLLLKMYPAPNGTIFLEGVDINDIPEEHLRDFVSYVPQEPFLFSTTIKENILFSVEESFGEQVEEYAKLAQVHEDITGFPDGYDTVVGERGITLSGGQKQRVTLARGLIKPAPVVILDDCLSAVDVDTEQRIIDELKKMLGERTLIVITHRLKVLAKADIIYVFDDGRIVESGSHDQLVSKDGLYRRMYELQLKEEQVLERSGD